MSKINKSNPVNFVFDGDVAVVQIRNPPVNALSHGVRAGLQESIRTALANKCKAIVISCEGRSFFVGADIREFGKPSKAPLLSDLINEIEACPILVVAAVHGSALGGGLEIALGAHYRIALASAKFGLPEVTLGLLPGAGGTQRLPRIIEANEAANMICGGKPITATKALSLGLIDKIVSGNDICREGVVFANKLIADGKCTRPTRELSCNLLDTEDVKALRIEVGKRAREAIAPLACLDALDAAMSLPFETGLKRERELFLELMETEQRTALIYAFFSERQAGKLPEIEGVVPRSIEKVGIVGGGTMGVGIAVSALLNGLDVTLLERDIDRASTANINVRKILGDAVVRGKLSNESLELILSNSFRVTMDYVDFYQADLAIEAVYESLEVKQEVFSKLDEACRKGAILASNTSYLNLNQIAAMTSRPEDVIGLHFFSPAHIMRLLEVVVGEKSSPEVVASGFALSKKLKKVAVRASVCDGFIGNRILAHCVKANFYMVLEGASPFQVDKVLTDFGLAMGPFAVGDLAGLDIGWANRKRLAATRKKNETYPEFADRLCEKGRFGRKTGRGFYIYDEGERNGRPDYEVEEIIAAERTKKGIVSQAFSAEEIVDRYMAAMVNEASRIIEEGIALRPLDVDVTLLNGYGYPRWRGGPMQYADTVGLDKILTDIKRFAKKDALFWQPARLLERLVVEGKPFSSLNDLGENL